MTKSEENNKLLLLDVSALVFRAYHALPELTTNDGKPAGGLYGFLSILLKTIQERQPAYIAAAIDLPGRTFRDDLYTEYKATRSETPEDLKIQFPLVYEALAALKIPVLGAEGYEADDVLATVARKALKDDAKVVVEIESGDQDILQLVEERITVLAPGRKPTDIRVMDADAVEKKLGVAPERVIDFKALCGDSSDNIIGVEKVGPKTAAQLLKISPTLEALIEHAEAKKVQELPGIGATTEERILEAGERILLNRVLVTLKDDVPVEFSLTKARVERFPEPGFTSLLSRWGFETLLKRFTGSSQSEKSKDTKKQGSLAFADVEQTMEAFIQAQEEQVLGEIAEKEKSGEFSETVAELERSVVPIVSAMERKGILVDKKELAALKKRFAKKRNDIAKRIYQETGKTFNLASPKQLAEVLYDDLGIQSGKKTAGGQRSTAAAVLEDLAEEYPVVADVLAWREVQKLLSTYVETLPALVEGDGRIHARFWQLGTATGRIASSDPNLQNIPTRTEDGRAVRSVFVAPAGSVLMGADYSQVELRVAAVLAEEENMLSVFAADGDIHSATAERVFGVKKDEVTAEMRRRAKILNFGMLYGMGPRAVSKQMEVPYKEGVAFRKSYFAAFPRLSAWMEEVVEEARRNGYTETVFGRKRFLPELSSENHRVRAQAERAAINAPVQGTATGDLVKMGMVNITEAKAPLTLLVQVHDELLCEVEEKHIDDAAAALREQMERVWPEAPVALPVQIKTGTSWGEMKTYQPKG